MALAQQHDTAEQHGPGCNPPAATTPPPPGGRHNPNQEETT